MSSSASRRHVARQCYVFPFHRQRQARKFEVKVSCGQGRALDSRVELSSGSGRCSDDGTVFVEIAKSWMRWCLCGSSIQRFRGSSDGVRTGQQRNSGTPGALLSAAGTVRRYQSRSDGLVSDCTKKKRATNSVEEEIMQQSQSALLGNQKQRPFGKQSAVCVVGTSHGPVPVPRATSLFYTVYTTCASPPLRSRCAYVSHVKEAALCNCHSGVLSDLQQSPAVFAV